jgi:alkanesulfonate monooxygenase SsuD/methylene tetrahydromethanopterin reductase-like flavin-dependent oxidoreductase (luciferase family)
MKFGMPWNGPEVAAVAEQAGCAAFCTGDFADHDEYLQLAEMAKGTRRAEVGTAIAYAFARTPYAHATAARAVHHAAPGRMFLGFGSGARRINRDWFGVPADRPIARIKELLGAVRAYLDAENGDTVRSTTSEQTSVHPSSAVSICRCCWPDSTPEWRRQRVRSPMA